MQYKIVKYQDEDKSIVYTLCEVEKEADGEIVLVFEADSDDHASFIKNQFLHFEPYRPFNNCWIAEIRHVVYVDNKIVKEIPYENRTMMVIAWNESEAREKIITEATEYSKSYKNGEGKDVRWEFDQILSLEEIDFFSTIDLYRGVPVEIKSKRISMN